MTWILSAAQYAGNAALTVVVGVTVLGVLAFILLAVIEAIEGYGG